MITERTLTAKRKLTIHTSDRKIGESGLKFELNGVSVYIPIRTKELKIVRDALLAHIDSTRIYDPH